MAINPIFLMPDISSNYDKLAKDFIEQPIDFTYVSDDDDEFHREADDIFLAAYDPYD